MWRASLKAAISEVILVVALLIALMVKAGAGSGAAFILLMPINFAVALVRIHLVLTFATALASNRNAFWFLSMALGILSGLAIATGLRESGWNLVLLATALTLSTAAGCYFAPDET